uniref:Uncharacterized protein n=1 Tax=Anopheles darlingi TaxID=43151 RepID=A0A2M4CVV6_ANODA
MRPSCLWYALISPWRVRRRDSFEISLFVLARARFETTNIRDPPSFTYSFVAPLHVFFCFLRFLSDERCWREKTRMHAKRTKTPFTHFSTPPSPGDDAKRWLHQQESRYLLA